MIMQQRKQGKGTGAIDVALVTTREAGRLVVRVHVDAVPVTAEELTVTIEDSTDSDYNTLWQSVDLATDSVQDVHVDGVVLLNGETVRVEYANTDANTVAVSIVTGG